MFVNIDPASASQLGLSLAVPRSVSELWFTTLVIKDLILFLEIFMNIKNSVLLSLLFSFEYIVCSYKLMFLYEDNIFLQHLYVKKNFKFSHKLGQLFKSKKHMFTRLPFETHVLTRLHIVYSEYTITGLYTSFLGLQISFYHITHCYKSCTISLLF